LHKSTKANRKDLNPPSKRKEVEDSNQRNRFTYELFSQNSSKTDIMAGETHISNLICKMETNILNIIYKMLIEHKITFNQEIAIISKPQASNIFQNII
jgi:hypothetical protein